MKKFKTILLLATSMLSILTSGCGSDIIDAESEEPVPKKEWTYMIYLGGDNNLSEFGLMDLNEMEMAGSTDEVAIVLQAEFSNEYSSDVPTDTMRFLVENDNDPSAANLGAGISIGNVDMADRSNLTDFINWAKTNHSAKHYALVLWDHGDGWKDRSVSATEGRVLRGAIQDETSGSFMSLPDLAGAVRDSGVHFDIINFDACLMGMYEVAYEFNGLSNYMVFSEEVVPFDGDPYDTILTALTNDPTMPPSSLVETIVTNFNEYYLSNDRGYTTKSAIDLSRIDILDTKLNELADALIADTTDIGTIISAAQDNTQEYAYPYNHDIVDFCNYLEAHSSNSMVVNSLCPEIRTIISSLVTINLTNGPEVSDSHGIAFYLPKSLETTNVDLEEYGLLACNQSQSSTGGTWGAYVNHLVANSPEGPITLVPGGFEFRVYWTDLAGDACDADIDLYVNEPSGQAYAPWMGPMTPNGFFSSDSSVSGVSEEYFIANEDIASGAYDFILNYYDDGINCTNALVHISFLYSDGTESEIIDPIEMNLSAPHENDCEAEAYPDYFDCINGYSDYWYPGWVEANEDSLIFSSHGERTIYTSKGIRLDIVINKKKDMPLVSIPKQGID